jgi:tRNA (guanine37-N1)-methyltransferase
MRFNIITIFPEIIRSYYKETILARAVKNKIIDLNVVSLRDFTEDKHQKVDDTPYGGGAGMVMKPEPLFKALTSLDAIPFRKTSALGKLKKVFGLVKKSAQGGSALGRKRTILMSPRGRQFTQRIAEEWSAYSELTFICGRYEGIDQRVVDHMIDEEVSIGPYVLAGGELGALVISEAVSRLIPGVLGNADSLKEETHNIEMNGGEYPQYTKPLDFKGWKVPAILLSGDHKKIADWRKKIGK